MIGYPTKRLINGFKNKVVLFSSPSNWNWIVPLWAQFRPWENKSINLIAYGTISQGWTYTSPDLGLTFNPQPLSKVKQKSMATVSTVDACISSCADGFCCVERVQVSIFVCNFPPLGLQHVSESQWSCENSPENPTHVDYKVKDYFKYVL